MKTDRFDDAIPKARRRLFVSGHEPAREWARKHVPDLAARGEFVPHLGAGQVAGLGPGDVVAGTLPVNLIAAVNRQGARYLHLTLDLPPEVRGQSNLTVDAMERYGARLAPYIAVSLADTDADADEEPSPGQNADLPNAIGRRSRQLLRRVWWNKALGLLLLGLVALCAGLSTNILAPFVISSLPVPDAIRQANLWSAAHVVAGAGLWVAFLLFSAALYSWRNRFFVHSIAPRRDRAKDPCRILITALSNDGTDTASGRQRGDLLRAALQDDPGLDLQTLRLPTKELAQRLGAPDGKLPGWATANWLTNVVAIGAHARRLETIVVVPSRDSAQNKGSDGRFEIFCQVVQIIWSRSRWASRPLQIIKVHARDYENYQDVLDGIDEAIACGIASVKAARAGIGSSRDICIDITSGTKPISVAGAVSTMNKEHTFMYVTNDRHYWIFDAKIGIGDALSV